LTQNKSFNGFTKETVDFFSRLKKHNERDWFQKHKNIYDTSVIDQARSFVVTMGERLKDISPGILAIPKINKSLFRIYRDTRFSPDKSPYKTHLGLFFWEGERPKMECSGFYFHLEPPDLMLGVGIYMFSKAQVSLFRRAVVDPESGQNLSEVIKSLLQVEGFSLGGSHYIRIPPGFEGDHPLSSLLLHNGLYAGITLPIPAVLYSPGLIDFCWDYFKNLAPLHKWLVDIGIGFFGRP